MPIAWNTAELKYPRRGSDFTIWAPSDGGGVAVILDLIGQTASWGLKRHVTRIERDLDRLAQVWTDLPPDDAGSAFREWILSTNAEIHEVVSREDARNPEPGGFSMAAAFIQHGHGHVHWLGDCRAYRVDTAGPACELLTRDHNKLQTVMTDQTDFAFLQNEMQEFSRSMHYYWGHPDQERIRKVLADQPGPSALTASQGLLLLSDGMFLPIVRSLLDLNCFRLSEHDFRLDEWMGRFLGSGDYFNPEEPRETPWEDVLNELADFTRRYTNRKARYRDDMAGICVYSTGS